MKKFKLLSSLLFILLIAGITKHVYSAPDPLEVERIKSNAPVHLIGLVTADTLHKDLSKEIGKNYQLRKMTIEVDHFIKNNLNVSKVLDVYYSYIPSWQANQWDGGKRVDIQVNDEIEIWLVNGEYGLSSALGDNTINHLKYAPDRNEPIQEPTLHLFKRKAEEAWTIHSNIMVLASLLLLLSIIIISSYKNKEKMEK